MRRRGESNFRIGIFTNITRAQKDELGGLPPEFEGASSGLNMTEIRGWLVGAWPPDPSLTRFSNIKTFDRLFLYKAGT
jgi:hypothetical protein